MMTQHLDLLTDEPLELAVALRKLSETKANEDGEDKAWAKFAKTMIELVAELQAINEPDVKSE